MSDWRATKGDDWYKAAMSGRPVLAFGTPNRGFNVQRHAIIFFETGKGWREANTFDGFTADVWIPLQEPSQ